MTFQNSLFSLEVMQDRTGRCVDYPAPPSNYLECIPNKEARGLPPDHPDAKRCQCFGCPYNLIGEIGRMQSNSDMERAIIQRYETETWDTCLLDVLGPPDHLGRSQELEDSVTGRLLGISGERVAQVGANAFFKFKKAYLTHNECSKTAAEIRMELDELEDDLEQPTPAP